MGQRARQLRPSASALHYFGAELRRLRVAAGISQDRLGGLVNYSGDLVRRVETADRVPSERFVDGCDEVLGAEGALTSLWKAAGFHAMRRPRLGDSGFIPSALDRPALDWLLGDSGLGDGDLARRVPDEEAIIRASSQLARLRETDHRHGAGAVHEQIAAFVRAEVKPLCTATDGPTVSSLGRATIIGAYELAGYAAVDVGCVGAAQRHYLDGLAASGTDRLFGGYLIGVSLAHLALHCDDPGQALRMSRTAIAGTGGLATPAVRASLAAVAARAYARMGDEKECTLALAAADRDLDASRPGDEPAWIGYFDGAYLADERAHCLVDLGRHAQAQIDIRQAVRALDPTRRRRLAIDTALLATSMAATGEVEEACRVGMVAADHAAAIASMRSSHRVLQILARLADYSEVAAVREFREYVSERLPSVGGFGFTSTSDAGGVQPWRDRRR